jgi:hypothetical protein
VAAGNSLVFSNDWGTTTWTGAYTGSGDGSVILAGDLSIGAAGATFDFPAGFFQWMGGRIRGVDTDGSDVLTNLGTLSLPRNTYNPSTRSWRYLTINNAGTILHTDDVLDPVGGVLNNLPGGTYDLDGDAWIRGGPLVINNAGLLVKSAGSGTSTIECPLNNTGSVESRSGTLDFRSTVTQVSGNALTGGTWSATSGSTLTISSAGNLTASAASITLSGAGANFTNIARLASLTGSLAVTGGETFTSSAIPSA